MINKIKILILAGAMIVAMPVFGQEPSSLSPAAPASQQSQTTWTLKGCIDYAVEHNITVKQQQLMIDNSEIQLNTTKSSRLPDLNAGASQSFNFGRSPSMATGIYEQNRSSSTGLSLSSSMPLYMGGRISNRIKQNELDLKAATEGLQRAKDDLALNIALYYLEALYRKELLKVAKEQRSLTAREVERTDAMVASGTAPRSQLFDIKAKLAADQLAVTNADNNLKLALLNLAQLLNLENVEGFDIIEPEMPDMPETLQSAASIFETASTTRPEVKQAEYRVQSSEYAIKVAKASYYPSLSLGLSYNNGFNQILDANNHNEAIADQLHNNQREAVGLNLNIPIFNRWQTRNAVRSAQLNLQNYQLELENVRLTLQKEIQQAYQSAVAAKARYTSTEEAFKAANEAFAYAQERYGVGKATVYEYAEAQAKLFSSRSEQLQARYEFLFRARILDFYLGKTLE